MAVAGIFCVIGPTKSPNYRDIRCDNEKASKTVLRYQLDLFAILYLAINSPAEWEIKYYGIQSDRLRDTKWEAIQKLFFNSDDEAENV